jgi:hypothetical protein
MRQTLVLNRRFYPRSVIENAIDAFSQICSAKILDDSFTIELITENEADSKLVNEFCNYCLGLVKQDGI